MKLSTVFTASLITLWLPFNSTSLAMEPGTLDIALTYDYSEGDYGGARDTKIHYIPISLSYQTFPWIFKLTIPSIHISGPGIVIGGADGGIVTGSEMGVHVSEQGLGDIILSSTYALDNFFNTPPYFDVTTKIKLPTGDEDKLLGTGETDFSLQMDIANNYDRLTPFATLGYKFVGEPEAVDYNNSIFASAGMNWKLSDAYSTGLIYDFRQAVVDTVEDPKEGIIYLNWKSDRKLAMMTYAVAGFSAASPDYALGLRIKYSL